MTELSSPRQLDPPSAEQMAIVELARTCNLIVDSVAGSGKTTTAAWIAAKYPDANILLLTYNSRLRLETRSRIAMLGLQNMEVHTYHSFGVRYISACCKTDIGLLAFLERCAIGAIPWRMRPPKYDMLIVDECQDMTPTYYKLFRAIFCESSDAVMCVVGDKHQGIYEFAGADTRFITMAEHIHPRILCDDSDKKSGAGSLRTAEEKPWRHLNLTTSYRLTREIAQFTNFVIGEPRVKATRSGPLPKYYAIGFGRGADGAHKVGELILDLLETNPPEDIFILAASVKCGNNKENAVVRDIANQLTMNKVRLYLPMTDVSKIDEDVTAGKVVFASFHQSKGLERRIVIILGFDAGYFAKYARNCDSLICPSTIYVAMTRAKEQLYIFQDIARPPFAFVDTAKLAEYAEVYGVKNMKPASNRAGAVDHRAIFVTTLVEHLTTEFMQRCLKHAIVTNVREQGKEIQLPVKAEQVVNGVTFTEEVSAINGLAIPTLWEWNHRGDAAVLQYLREHRRPHHDFFDSAGQLKITARDPDKTVKSRRQTARRPPAADKPQIPPGQLAKICNEYIAISNGVYFPTRQIRNYNWLKRAQVGLCLDRLSNELATMTNPRMEHLVTCDVLGKKIRGRIDVLCDDRIWELKCVVDLALEHQLQVIVYGYAHYIMTGNMLPCYLFNIRNDELLRIDITPETGKTILRMLVCNKRHEQAPLSDAGFLAAVGCGPEVPQLACRDCAAAMI